MQQNFEEMQSCYVQLRGKCNQQLFETEIQKMKILNIAVTCRDDTGIQVLAYCVLDNEMHLVLRAPNAGQVECFLNNLIMEYETTVIKTLTCQTVFRKPVRHRLTKEKQTERYCVRVHLFPVGLGLVDKPEDYWWCSYRDYLGRRWLPLTSVGHLLSRMDDEPRKAMRRIRSLHQRTNGEVSTI